MEKVYKIEVRNHSENKSFLKIRELLFEKQLEFKYSKIM